MEEARARNHVVNIARGWVGTPYHSGARVKGHGADCLTSLAGIFEEAGLVPRVEIPHYAHDWHMHRSIELYLEGLLKYTHEIPGPPQPGDIAVWKFGRCFSHGAIVVKWPEIIHAYVGSSCRYENVEAAEWLKFVGERGPDKGKPRPVRFFSFWG